MTVSAGQFFAVQKMCEMCHSVAIFSSSQGHAAAVIHYIGMSHISEVQKTLSDSQALSNTNSNDVLLGII